MEGTMGTSSKKPLYQHCGIGLLRAAAAPLSQLPERWPDPSDTEACRAWLNEVWSNPDFADSIRHASPGLAAQVDAVDDSLAVKQIRRATLATIRYLLRAA